MKNHSFLEYLKNNPVLFDGAMGTYIYQKGVFIDKCYDALNITNPDLIRTIHTEYVSAGADIIETNTFGANRFKLQKHNLIEQLSQINISGAILAREAIGDGFVAGSMGPLGVNINPWGEISLDEVKAAFVEQTKALVEGEIDVFILETFQNIDELEQAVLAVREICDLPLIAQMAFQEDAYTIYGTSLGEMARRLNDLPVDVIGLNCVLGPKQILDHLEQLIQFTDKPISIMPNAGLPQVVEGRMFYMSTPDYFSVYAMRFIQTGARIIGGCCGSTPDHIKKMADAITQKQTRLQKRLNVSMPQPQLINLPEPIPTSQKSCLAQKLMKKSYVTLVEMISPKGKDLSKQIDGAEKLKKCGIDAINIPDGPRASARMNGMAMAIIIQDRIGIETILHYTCRDRNLLGIQSDLLGASVLGIKNILAITGDPPKMGDYPDATAVFDIDSIGLVKLLSNLNRGLDIGNKPIGQPTEFLIGVGLDPNCVNLSLEQERFRKKIAAGAEYVITQPVFDSNILENFLESVANSSIPIIAGIWPLISVRNAEFLKHEVPGVYIPDILIELIARFSSKEDQLKAGIEIAQHMALAVKPFTQGIQICAPFGRVQIAIEVSEAVIENI